MLADREAPVIREARRGTQPGLPGGLNDLGYKLPSEGGTIINSFFNMANSIIGAGIIGLPFAFSCTGYIIGVLLLLALTVVVDWTIRLIVVNAKLSGQDSYQDIVEFCFGNVGLVAVSLAQVLFAFGGMVGFCVIIGDTIPDVILSAFPKVQHKPVLWLFANRQFIVMLCTLLISYPLSLYRDITKLAKASALALISMILIILTVIMQGPFSADQYRGAERAEAFILNMNSLKAISVISFAFVCHHNSLLIYGSLKKPTIDRFATVTHISTGISCLACMIMALTGYLVFAEKTRGNILNNFPRDDGNVMVILARFCFGFNCFTTLPIEAFVCREVVIKCFYAPRIKHREFTQMHHVAVTSAFVFGAMLISLFVHDLGIVLDIVGGTSACALAYILPPACYLTLLEGPFLKDYRKWLAAACVFFGILVMIASIVKVFV
ncbi:transmembrane amino acid transporter protein-domain-containing protein [Protomyces lactucae-debilis]|uniref:Transmembrane amino acid transporter protein-domain-containing protein n=1 Tax=Protomyces lactucae-debilis TaxID=2754530 RepID=A0A1Y2FI92_PROLT|nr:transmembrane amino acid transporter protein-domain-containing protein [Protomyces lactucae-debilis]ORY83104.1 transmembrane amino acid transporter protein-domain-containing protein [Protomyces lactucae-debilis]